MRADYNAPAEGFSALKVSGCPNECSDFLIVQALRVAEQIAPGREVPHLQLQAQLLYRLDRHDAALKLYEQLYHTHKVTFEDICVICWNKEQPWLSVGDGTQHSRAGNLPGKHQLWHISCYFALSKLIRP